MLCERNPVKMAAPREPLICWLVLIGLALNICIADGTLRAYGIFYLDFLDMFGQGAFKTGWIMTAFSLSSMAVSPFVGWLCDHFPLWQPLVGAALIGCVAMWGCSLAPSLLATIFTWGVVHGVSNSLLITGSVAATSKIFPYNRSLALGMLFAGGSVGGIVFPGFNIRLRDIFGTRGTVRLYGGVLLNVLISAVLVWSHGRHITSAGRQNIGNSHKKIQETDLFKETSENLENKTSAISVVNINGTNEIKETEVTTSCSKSGGKCKDDATQSDVKQGCCQSRFCKLVSLQFFCVFFYQFGIIFGFGGFLTYVPAYAEELGLTTNQGSILLVINGVADLFGRILIGLIANLECTNLYLLLIANLLTGAAMFIILTIFPGYYVLALTMVVLGFFVGGSTPMLGQLVVDAVGPELAGTGVGIANLGFGMGLSIHPLITGAIRELSSSYASVPHLSTAAFVFAALALLTGRRCRPCKSLCCAVKSYEVTNPARSSPSIVPSPSSVHM